MEFVTFRVREREERASERASQYRQLATGIFSQLNLLRPREAEIILHELPIYYIFDHQNKISFGLSVVEQPNTPPLGSGGLMQYHQNNIQSSQINTGFLLSYQFHVNELNSTVQFVYP